MIEETHAGLIGEYVETYVFDRYVEHKFLVKEWLYGEKNDGEIYVYENLGMAYVENGYFYEMGAVKYEKGLDYMLLAYRSELPVYEHDRYMIMCDTLFCESTGKYMRYGEPVEVPVEGMTIREYVCSIYNVYAQPIGIEAPAVDYENEVAEMTGEAAYVGIVNIQSLFSEGKVHNGNVYRCTVESLSKGGELNTYDDGTILLTVTKDTVEVGKSYIIGFSPATDEYSLIYRQQTDASVYEVSDALLEEIAGYVTE